VANKRTPMFHSIASYCDEPVSS